MASRHRLHTASEWAELGARIKAARLKAGMTQEETAAIFGRKHSFIANVERGQRQLTVLEFRDLCRAFDVPCDSLLGG